MRFNLKKQAESVNDIIGQFKDTVQRLRFVAEREVKASEDKLQQAAELRRESDVHYAEGQRAANIASNIEKLLA